MEQTYESRGKLAFVQDQTEMAVAAFEAGQLKDVEAILAGIRDFLHKWLSQQPI